MIKAHQIQLNPTKKQLELLGKSCGVARFSFNWALDRWNSLFKEGEKTSAYSLIKFQNSIKKEEFPWMGEVSKTAPQYACWDVEDAWKKYFKGLKDGTIEKGKLAYIKNRKKRGLEISNKKLADFGKPNFKKKGIKDSYVAVENQVQFKQKDKKIWLPRIGWVRCHEDLRFEGKVNNVVVKRIANKWFAVINIETVSNEAPMPSENQVVVGVDLGIKTLLTLSDGTTFENPKALKSNLKGLKRLQRGLSRKVKGSNNRKKQQMRVATKYYRVSNIRKNAIHQATSKITDNYDVIVIEDLNVKGMVKNHKLAQSLNDASFSEIRRQLTYKCQWKGKELIVADMFYASSKLCSSCGNKKDNLKLSERVYKCSECNMQMDRDKNASINLASLALPANCGNVKPGGERMALVQSSSVKQEHKLIKKGIFPHNF